MEGALLRANKDRHNTASKSSLPDHLLIFRTKIILNRLPTRQERHRRGDTHADGTHVEATCPNCAHPILGGLVMWILNKKVIKVKYFIPNLAK
jgi:hypothetical protein